MADTSIQVKDASAQSKLFLAKINPDGSHTFYHVENEPQRTALLAAFAPLSTSALQSTANASLSTIAANTASIATVAGQTTANTTLSTIATNTARPVAAVTTGSLSAAGAGNSAIVRGTFNISVWGTWNGQYQIECSFDNSTWLPLTALANPITFSSNMREQFEEPEANVRYRVNFSTLNSGTASYRISQ